MIAQNIQDEKIEDVFRILEQILGSVEASGRHKGSESKEMEKGCMVDT